MRFYRAAPCLLFSRSTSLGLRNATFYTLKDALLEAEMPPFGMQKVSS